MESQELISRTKKYSIAVITLTDDLYDYKNRRTILNQLLRSSTSVGANYRAACRARSDREFYSKMCIVVEEADETIYWLELLLDTVSLKAKMTMIQQLLKEANELTAIFSKSKSTAGKRISKNRFNNNSI